MHLRNVATAFLLNDNDVLMMKRAAHKKIAPGYWYGVGGHLEPNELNDPTAACIREVWEETKIEAAQISGFKLRYIVMRRSRTEIVINYFFFGWAETREITANEEGTLHWVPRPEALKRKLFPAIGLTLQHYFETENILLENGLEPDNVEFGMVTLAEGQPAIQWLDVLDWKDQD